MAKQIMFKIVTEAGPEEVSGQVALLNVGDRRHKFVIHDGNLSDYRSGYGVGSLMSIKVERMARISSYTRTTDRQAAQILMDRIVAKVGIEKVEQILAQKPTLNQ